MKGIEKRLSELEIGGRGQMPDWVRRCLSEMFPEFKEIEKIKFTWIDENES